MLATALGLPLEKVPQLVAALPVSDLDIGLAHPHPCILPSDYLKTLARSAKLQNLTGGQATGYSGKSCSLRAQSSAVRFARTRMGICHPYLPDR